MEQNTLVNISVCLSDLPQEALKTGKNGKVYISLDVYPRKEKSAYDEDINVSVSRSKEDREAKKDRKYVGSGRFVDFRQQKTADMPPATPEAVAGLAWNQGPAAPGAAAEYTAPPANTGTPVAQTGDDLPF